MRVKTLKPHENGYGADYKKKRGDVYNHPDPAALIALGYVKEAPEDDRDNGKNDRVRGNGKAPIPAKKLDGKKHDSASNVKKSRTNPTNGGDAGTEGRRDALGGDSDVETGDKSE